MVEETTLDQFRRYLQDQLVEAEEMSNKKEKIKRIKEIESALFQAINFSKSVDDRKMIESVLFDESSSVRLLSLMVTLVQNAKSLQTTT
jgi:hypothetical protein